MGFLNCLFASKGKALDAVGLTKHHIFKMSKHETKYISLH